MINKDFQFPISGCSSLIKTRMVETQHIRISSLMVTSNSAQTSSKYLLKKQQPRFFRAERRIIPKPMTKSPYSCPKLISLCFSHAYIVEFIYFLSFVFVDVLLTNMCICDYTDSLLVRNKTLIYIFLTLYLTLRMGVYTQILLF